MRIFVRFYFLAGKNYEEMRKGAGPSPLISEEKTGKMVPVRFKVVFFIN